MKEKVEYKINIEPSSVCIDLDKYPCGNGMKDLRIIVNGEEFIFTKDQIHKLLSTIKGRQ